MDKYKKNLRVDGDKVYSYGTHVATIKGNKLVPHGYWSTTTSKHINYVANQLGLQKTESEAIKEKKKDMAGKMGDFGAIKMVARMGDIFGKNPKEKNDWKKRMLNAGLSNRGLDFPDDFDSLSEKERARRLKGAMDYL